MNSRLRRFSAAVAFCLIFLLLAGFDGCAHSVPSAVAKTPAQQLYAAWSEFAVAAELCEAYSKTEGANPDVVRGMYAAAVAGTEAFNIARAALLENDSGKFKAALGAGLTATQHLLSALSEVGAFPDALNPLLGNTSSVAPSAALPAHDALDPRFLPPLVHALCVGPIGGPTCSLRRIG